MRMRCACVWSWDVWEGVEGKESEETKIEGGGGGKAIDFVAEKMSSPSETKGE